MIFTLKSVTVAVEKYKCDWKLNKYFIYYYKYMMLRYCEPGTWEESKNYFYSSVKHPVLIHLSLMLHFYTFWKCQKTKGFPTFSESIEMEH